MSGLLQEIIGSCPESKRHPADTLRDIEVLLHKGADPNLAEVNGVMPLRRCLEQTPAVDLVPRLQMLLAAGADPEDEDRDGIQPFVLAARILNEPLLSEVMQIMVVHMRGRYSCVVGGVVRAWSVKYFPISASPTYEQVMSSTDSTGDFRLEMLDMVPEGIRDTFQRAYFTVVSKNFLDTMTRAAKTRLLTSRDKDEIIWIVGMRQAVNLAHYHFDQELVAALLDPQPMLDMEIEPTAVEQASTEPSQTVSLDIPYSLPTSPSDGISPRSVWQFNPDNHAVTSADADKAAPSSTTSCEDEYMIPSTTLIRWRDPESRPKPGDLDKACASVLRYECATCADGVLLTQKEHEKHETEHAHTVSCKKTLCARRFCALNKGKKNMISLGCQNHRFPV
ncbi:hypothetical protein ACEQ8H_002780 [Pleosporales sp. CAS-2024a]